MVVHFDLHPLTNIFRIFEATQSKSMDLRATLQGGLGLFKYNLLYLMLLIDDKTMVR